MSDEPYIEKTEYHVLDASGDAVAWYGEGEQAHAIDAANIIPGGSVEKVVYWGNTRETIFTQGEE